MLGKARRILVKFAIGMAAALVALTIAQFATSTMFACNREEDVCLQVPTLPTDNWYRVPDAHPPFNTRELIALEKYHAWTQTQRYRAWRWRANITFI